MREELFKHLSTVWVNTDGNRVAAGTPGATAQKIESRKWYARIKVNGKWKKVPLSTDKRAALKKLADMTTRIERGTVGLLDPYETTKKAKVADELLPLYLADLRERGRDDVYIRGVKRQINTILGALDATTINDLTVDGLDRGYNYVLAFDCRHCSYCIPHLSLDGEYMVGSAGRWCIGLAHCTLR